MEFTELDSSQMVAQRQMEYYQLVSGNSALFVGDFALPELNFQEEYLNRYALNLDFAAISNYNLSGFSVGSMYSFYSPYYRNATILSSAAYKLSDKFTLGGFSYGSNSIHSAPLPNQGMNNFDAYGSTLFMEYKVSKNFRIETRVNVQQGGNHPGF